MDRRDFVRRLGAVPVAAWVGAGALPLTACAGLPVVAPGGTLDRLVVPASAVGPDGVLLQRPEMDRPVYLFRSGEELVALLLRCTHRGCQPEPRPDRLVCPCHGSEFDRTGAVLEGPAERPLLRFDVRTEGEMVVVRTRERVR